VSYQALAIALSSNDDVEPMFGSFTEHMCRSLAGSSFHLINKTTMHCNHVAQNIRDDADFAGVHSELQATTLTKRNVDHDVQYEVTRRAIEAAQTAVDNWAK